MKVLSESEIQSLFTWIDEVPVSRPKKNVARDFSDGVLVAEIIRHFLPKLVEIHNYPAANSVAQKVYNWNTLNHKLFRKIGYFPNDEVVQNIVQSKPGYIEFLLYELRQKLETYLLKSRQFEMYQNPFNHSPPMGGISAALDMDEMLGSIKKSHHSHHIHPYQEPTHQPVLNHHHQQKQQHHHLIPQQPLQQQQQPPPPQHQQSHPRNSQNNNIAAPYHSGDDEEQFPVMHHNALDEDQEPSQPPPPLLKKQSKASIKSSGKAGGSLSLSVSQQQRANQSKKTNPHQQHEAQLLDPVTEMPMYELPPHILMHHQQQQQHQQNQQQRLPLPPSIKNTSKNSSSHSRQISEQSVQSNSNSSHTRQQLHRNPATSSSSAPSKKEGGKERTIKETNIKPSTKSSSIPAHSTTATDSTFLTSIPPSSTTITMNHTALDKDFLIKELNETVGVLQLKTSKLEHLLLLKDKKIEELVGILQKNHLMDK